MSSVIPVLIRWHLVSDILLPCQISTYIKLNTPSFLYFHTTPSQKYKFSISSASLFLLKGPLLSLSVRFKSLESSVFWVPYIRSRTKPYRFFLLKCISYSPDLLPHYSAASLFILLWPVVPKHNFHAQSRSFLKKKKKLSSFCPPHCLNASHLNSSPCFSRPSLIWPPSRHAFLFLPTNHLFTISWTFLILCLKSFQKLGIFSLPPCPKLYLFFKA